jgi:hypothetical protein
LRLRWRCHGLAALAPGPLRPLVSCPRPPLCWAQADNLADLEADGIHIWHFEQHELEAVYIPGGCPHDVRNLRPCIKVGAGPAAAAAAAAGSLALAELCALPGPSHLRSSKPKP